MSTVYIKSIRNAERPSIDGKPKCTVEPPLAESQALAAVPARSNPDDLLFFPGHRVVYVDFEKLLPEPTRSQISPQQKCKPPSTAG